MARIFISYRRDDSGYVSAQLNDSLQARFGRNSVFFDVDHIPIGVDFRQHIADAVGACDALVVVIGDRWLDARNDEGQRRLDDEADYVRLEIEAAFKRDIVVVPVLVDKAVMPVAGALPATLARLAHLNAAEIRAGRDFKLHVERLVDALEQAVPAAGTRARPRKTRRAAAPGEAASGEAAPPAAADKSLASAAALAQIEAAVGRLKDSRLFVGSAIPDVQARSAAAAYAPRVKTSQILLLYDNTVFGSAKDGLLMTGEQVYWRNSWLSSGSKRYADIDKVEVELAKLAGMNILVDGQKIYLASGDFAKVAAAVADALRSLSKAARRGTRTRKSSD